MIVSYLQKATFDVKTVRSRRSQPKLTVAEHGHHCGVAGENAHFAIERRCNYRFGLTFEQNAFGRDD